MSREERLKAIRGRVERATPEPWEQEYDSESYGQWYQCGPARISYGWHRPHEGERQAGADATFISAARSDVPWLLAEFERAMAVITEVRTIADDPFETKERTRLHAILRVIAAYDAGGGA